MDIKNTGFNARFGTRYCVCIEFEPAEQAIAPHNRTSDIRESIVLQNYKTINKFVERNSMCRHKSRPRRRFYFRNKLVATVGCRLLL